MSHSSLRVVKIDQGNLSAARAFLERAPETSMFLLSNIRAFGPCLGENIYSGNIKGIEQDRELAGIFCVTRGGSLLAQTAGHVEFAPEILRACVEESIPIRSALGEWQIMSAVWDLLLEAHAVAPTFVSKEVLYRLDLPPATAAPVLPPFTVRMLSREDHEQWDTLSTEFQKETHLPAQGTREERKAAFMRSVELSHWWGAFRDNRLVSMGAVIAMHEKMAQVGAVFTVPNERGRGLSRAVMTALIGDSKRAGINRLFLFTGEANVPARRMYETLGFESFGHFGLFFGDPKAATL